MTQNAPSTLTDAAALPLFVPGTAVAKNSTPEAKAPEPKAPEKQPAPAPLAKPTTSRVWQTDFAQLDMYETVQLADDIIQRGQPEFLITANVNYLMLVDEHPRLTEVNERAAAIIADGNPIVWRSKLNETKLPCRVAGADLITELAGLAANRGYRIFFLGGAPGVAQSAADVLQQRFPKMQVAGCYAPPFRPMTGAEHAELLSRIRDAKADILLVAFGQPKGEFWIYDNLTELNVPLSIQLGASFDFLAGTATRAPAVWQKFGCEWLYRAMADPARLVPRYAQNIGFLGLSLLRDLLGRR